MRDLNIFYQERPDAVFGLRSLLFFYIFMLACKEMPNADINKSSCHHLVRCNIQDRKNTAGKQTQNIPAEIAEVKDKQVELQSQKPLLL